jgi:hypothetical protein
LTSHVRDERDGRRGSERDACIGDLFELRGVSAEQRQLVPVLRKLEGNGSA